jgi:O-antigen/teichoic acid export membrane protein
MILSVLKSAFGGSGAQAINFLAVPILARLYTPDDFAFWALCFAGMLLIGSIASFRYELAIMIPNDEQEAADVFWVALFIAAAMSLIGGGMFALPAVRNLLGVADKLDAWHAAMLFFSSTATLGSMTILINWANRRDLYGLRALAQIVLASVTAAFQIAWALFGGLGAWGLIWGIVAGQLMAIAVLLAGLLRSGQEPSLPSGLKGMSIVLRSHHRFPFFSTPLTVCGVARDRGTVVILEQHVVRAAIGSYAMVQRLVNFPVGMISGAIRPVLFNRMAREGLAVNEERIGAIHKLLLVLTTPWLAVIVVTADQVMPLLLGARWQGAGDMLRILVWPAYTFLFCNWMDRMLDVTSHQRTGLILEVIFATASLAGLGLGLALTGSLISALVIQAGLLVAYNVTYIVVAYRVANFKLGPLIPLIPLAVIIYTAFYLLMLLAGRWLSFIAAILIVSGSILISYVLAFRLMRREILCVRG